MALNALFTGSTGLQANSFALDVVGNNLANLNTTGYKAQRTLFKDLVYQTLAFGSQGDQNFGGQNAVQLGFGVAVGAIDSIFQQGSITPTARPLDVALQGSGFFTLRTGNGTVFTRAGTFSIDANGFLVEPSTGYLVQRVGTIGEGSATSPAFQIPGNNNIQIPFGTGVPGVPTQSVRYQGNISASTPIGTAVNTGIQIFDSQSQARVLTVTFTKTAINEYTVSADTAGATVTVPPTTLQFDTSGLLVSPSILPITISGLPGTAPQNIDLRLGTPGLADGISQFGGGSNVAAITQDGADAGTLSSVSVDQSGIIQGQFTNGRSFPVGQLAIAGFNNEGGLIRQGDNFYVPGAGSGEPLIGVAGEGGLGVIQGAALEGTNVDIAAEFARLIIAQRGFQVNARTITAADNQLQELANIIR